MHRGRLVLVLMFLQTSDLRVFLIKKLALRITEMRDHFSPQRPGKERVSAGEKVEGVSKETLPSEIATLSLVYDTESTTLAVSLETEPLRR